MKNLYALFVVLSCILGLGSSESTWFGHDNSVHHNHGGNSRDLESAADPFSLLVSNSGVQNKGSCTIANRLEPGFARKGSAFRTATTPDAANCASICADTVKGCVAINYRTSDKTCFFLGEPGYVDVSPGYTTALVNPSLGDICSSANMILGHDRRGQDLLGNPHTVESASDCCVLCYTTPNCISYAYVTGEKKCYVKNGAPAITEKAIVMTGLVCPAACK